MIRITGGKNKGRRLKVPKGRKTRPTLSRIRECLFNMLQERISGAHFLDLFAGTGIVAIEALSRGASRALLVEKRGELIPLIQENLALTGHEERATVICGDALTSLPRVSPFAPFTIVFADPPYTFNEYDRLVLYYLPLLRKGGIMAIQHLKKFSIEPTWKVPVRRKVIGEHCLTLIEREEE